MQGFSIFGGQVFAGFEVFKGFAQKACRTDRAVINLIPNFRGDHLYDGFNKRAGRVIFAAVSACVAHVLDFVFVQMRHLMLFSMGAEAEFINPVDDFPQVVAALNLVFQLAEYLSDFVFDGGGALG